MLLGEPIGVLGEVPVAKGGGEDARGESGAGDWNGEVLDVTETLSRLVSKAKRKSGSYEVRIAEQLIVAY